MTSQGLTRSDFSWSYSDSSPTERAKFLVEALILIEGNGPSRVADCQLMRETYKSTGSER